MSLGLTVTATAIPAVKTIAPQVAVDERGFFLESWHALKFAEAGLDLRFVQDNHSGSAGGTLRGLHYQVERAQGKLVRAVVGEIFDVAVDLRRSSPNFGKWVGVRLSAENRLMIWIPEGFAHGFYVTGERAEVLYKCTAPYAPQLERTIRWDDPDLAIDWPLFAGRPPIVSEKDRSGVGFREAETFA